MHESDLIALLENRFCSPEYALLPQVRNQTGFGYRVRTADALAMSLFPSRGLHLHGFEIKTARADWLNELKNPEKADAIAGYCHFWWMVAPGEKVIPKSEVPMNWGLLYPFGKTLRAAKNPEKMKPNSMDIEIVCGIMRKCTEIITPKSKIAESFRKGKAEGIKLGEENIKSKVEWVEKDLKELRKCLKEFEVKSGIKIEKWMDGNIGEAVYRLLNNDESKVLRRLNDVRRSMESAMKIIDEAVGALGRMEVIEKS